jgi:glycosyltransferase involved in cell wall biosynthesis
MQKMNIWYLSAHDQPRGMSARTYDFSRELVRRGHQVTMFTNSYCHFSHVERLETHEKWRIEEIDGIRVVWLHTFPYTGNGWRRGVNMLSNARRSLQVSRILTDKPDVVIGPSVPLGTGWAACTIAGLKGAAFVFEVRDVWPIALVDDGGLSRNHPVYYAFRFLEKYLYRKAHRISSTLPLVAKHVMQSGSDPEKVAWIPNGVDFELYANMDAYDGGIRQPLVVMYVGGFGNAHDVISLVRAARIFQDKGIDEFRFVLVGNGVKKEECMREASAYGLKNIEFHDPIPKAEVPRFQEQADVLVAAVLDSPIYRFGLNLNKLFDYLATGRPVIFSGIAPNDPVAESGAGFSVPPEHPEAMAKALLKVLEMKPEERIRMGTLGRRYVENNFDMKRLADRMELLLSQAIKDKGK